MGHSSVCKIQNYNTIRRKHIVCVNLECLGKDYFRQNMKNETNKIIYQFEFIEITYFILQKTLLKMKRQAVEWEKIFTLHVTDKRLICRICQNSYHPMKEDKTEQCLN